MFAWIQTSPLSLACGGERASVPHLPSLAIPMPVCSWRATDPPSADGSCSLYAYVETDLELKKRKYFKHRTLLCLLILLVDNLKRFKSYFRNVCFNQVKILPLIIVCLIEIFNEKKLLTNVFCFLPLPFLLPVMMRFILSRTNNPSYCLSTRLTAVTCTFFVIQHSPLLCKFYVFYVDCIIANSALLFRQV